MYTIYYTFLHLCSLENIQNKVMHLSIMIVAVWDNHHSLYSFRQYTTTHSALKQNKINSLIMHIYCLHHTEVILFSSPSVQIYFFSWKFLSKKYYVKTVTWAEHLFSQAWDWGNLVSPKSLVLSSKILSINVSSWLMIPLLEEIQWVPLCICSRD